MNKLIIDCAGACRIRSAAPLAASALALALMLGVTQSGQATEPFSASTSAMADSQTADRTPRAG